VQPCAMLACCVGSGSACLCKDNVLYNAGMHVGRKGARRELKQQLRPGAAAQVCGPGRRQAEGRVRDLRRALARRHLRLPGPAQEPRQGGGARPRSPRPRARAAARDVCCVPRLCLPAGYSAGAGKASGGQGWCSSTTGRARERARAAGSGRAQARARDLFYGLWTNDLFMRRVEANAEWSLFCPNEAPGLAETWGEAFDALYARYEREGRAKKVIKAQQLWFAILEAQARPRAGARGPRWRPGFRAPYGVCSRPGRGAMITPAARTALEAVRQECWVR